MNAPSLSLVVPVYNVAAYLAQCLESLAALDPAADEIIAIDDGSTDGSARILEDFSASLPTLRILRQVNSGASVARNSGLAAARGLYLAFVDADDFLAPDTFRIPLERAEALDLDIMMFNGWYHFEGRKADRLIYPDLPTSGPFSGQEWLVRHPIGQQFLHYPPLNLYRRDFLEAERLRFIPGQKHNEDVPWTTEALILARRVAYDARPWYYYRKPVRTLSPERLQLHLEAIVESSTANARELAAIIERHALGGEVRRVVAHQLVDGALSIFHKLKQMPNRQRAKAIARKLRRQGLIKLLWSHARDVVHYRRLVRQWLKSFA